ncbi:hypothetical protein [Spiroplasma poulsonii]|nr:hypothetical protein [Spiroplasma poulsonii]UNF62433.1 hypothetical protein MNU24_02910 [Spiroplasma poulsonii]
MAVKFYGNPIFFDMPVIGRPIIKGQFNKKVMNLADFINGCKLRILFW